MCKLQQYDTREVHIFLKNIFINIEAILTQFSSRIQLRFHISPSTGTLGYENV